MVCGMWAFKGNIASSFVPYQHDYSKVRIEMTGMKADKDKEGITKNMVII